MKREVRHEGLSKEMSQGFFHFPHGDEVDSHVLALEGLHVLPWDDDISEAELLGFGYTLLNPAHGAHFAA